MNRNMYFVSAYFVACPISLVAASGLFAYVSKFKSSSDVRIYKFERVENFKYLGVILNEDNNNQIDLQERINNANKTYFMLQKFFKYKNISKTLKN